jgi:5,10-methylenetetrahydromethanopterin reductase
MQFGIALPTDAASWRIVQHAEELGFASAWFYDTQMLSADCFVAMGAAAVKTSRIRLGTGVLIPSNRIAAVAANAFASLNKLAPGRIDMGLGTGFTGRRAMGLSAMPLRDFEEYIRVMLALLREEIVEAEVEGKRRKIALLNPDLGLIDTRSPMRLHLAAAGPRARALTAKLGAGWINFFSDVKAAVTMLGEMQDAWVAAGHARDALQSTAFVLGCVLEEGEPADSERAVAQAGPRACVLLHRAADEALSGLPNISPLPESVRREVEGYVALARSFEPKDAPWIRNHRGHLMMVKPEERPFVTAELIRITSFTATEPELKRRIGDLRDAGYSEFTVQLVPGQEHAIEDWARIMRAFQTA